LNREADAVFAGKGQPQCRIKGRQPGTPGYVGERAMTWP
jgi:hypothetical protein